jgi:D-glycero-D-manno-heptose 1,7-bisphosphate phosphatase
MSNKPAVVFLDRDGVIIEDREDYVRSWDDVTFISSSFSAIRQLTEAGLPVVLVTNQSAVGRGIITSEFVEETHARLAAEMEAQGANFAGVYFCPHHPDAGCNCRKPLPGLLKQASVDLGLDLAQAVMVGDSLRDIAAVEAVGGRGILVRTGKGEKECARLALSHEPAVSPIAVVNDIGDAVDFILNMGRE